MIINFLGLEVEAVRHFAQDYVWTPDTILRVKGRLGAIILHGPGPEGVAAQMARPVIVTRHAGLVDYLRAEWPETSAWEVIDHASADVVRGRVVVGVLPAHLAALALLHVEIPLDMSRAQRGAELDAAAVRAIAGAPRIYAVDGI